MSRPMKNAGGSVAFAIRPLLAFVVVSSLLQGADTASHDPWTGEQAITPEAFAKELKSGAPKKTHVACVAFDFMYKAAHIPGAVYIGAGRDPQAIEHLKTWAAGLPKGDPVLLYCGCCPMKECPNVRPAFAALKAMKFAHLMVLDIPRNFARDWAGKGLPIQKR
jgi:thiosulfate/3-mercaptopyruvate sulfurtransferase